MSTRSAPQFARYPYPHEYRAWRAPNSTTFTAYVAREVPELGLNLPSNAVGKDFLPGSTIFASAPSGSGFQVSLYGLAGLLFAIDEGFELNVLGLNIGVDAAVPALKLRGSVDWGWNADVASEPAPFRPSDIRRSRVRCAGRWKAD